MPKWREKFLVMGSPKYDRVLTVKRNKEYLPEEWVDKIYKKDGTRKKVLFYNITLAGMMEKDNMLDKIRRTVDRMKKEEDIVLWWRPHPLYESTMMNIRPDWVEEYRRIVEEYKQMDIGIFDKTPDMNRAIAQADVYYGDESSVMYLFQKVNKPVVLQNVDV